jgi:hypothetical protein
MKALLVKKTQFWYNLYQNNVGIGSTMKELQGYKLSQENCDEVFGVINVEKLAKKIFPKDGTTKQISLKQGFIAGYEKALELNQHKLNSFKEPEMFEVEIKVEPMNIDEIREQGQGFLNGNTMKPKLDENGCLILKGLQKKILFSF